MIMLLSFLFLALSHTYASKTTTQSRYLRWFFHAVCMGVSVCLCVCVSFAPLPSSSSCPLAPLSLPLPLSLSPSLSLTLSPSLAFSRSLFSTISNSIYVRLANINSPGDHPEHLLGTLRTLKNAPVYHTRLNAARERWWNGRQRTVSSSGVAAPPLKRPLETASLYADVRPLLTVCASATQ